MSEADRHPAERGVAVARNLLNLTHTTSFRSGTQFPRRFEGLKARTGALEHESEKSVQRFSENHALGLDPGDHAQTKS
jgi:hypothetical protein